MSTEPSESPIAGELMVSLIDDTERNSILY